MEISKITSSGRLTIPSELRKKYDIKRGTKIVFIENEGRIIIQKLDKNYFINLTDLLDEKSTMLTSLAKEKLSERKL